MEALDMGSNTLVSARIVEYSPPTKQPFDEIKGVVRARVAADEAESLAKKSGEQKLASLVVKADDAGFTPTEIVSRLKQTQVPPVALEAIMKADTRKLPVFLGVDIPGQGYAVYRINQVSQAAFDPVRAEAMAKQIENVFAAEDWFVFVQWLKQQGQVKILKPFTAN
jgi:peptidyl-prolyl cis-trans isomerase D